MRRTIEEAVENLVNFCLKYSDIWNNRNNPLYIKKKIPDDTERQKVLERLPQLEKDLSHIRNRKYKGTLPEELSKLLSNPSVGIFEFKESTDEIEALIRQYEDSMETEQLGEDVRATRLRVLRNLLIDRYEEFGSLEKFKEAYINALVSHNTKRLKELIGVDTSYFVLAFDVSQDNFIAKKGFERLVRDLLSISIHLPIVSDMQYFKENILNTIPSYCNPNVLASRYGLVDEESKLLDKTAKTDKAMRQCKSPSRLMDLQSTFPTREYEEKFIRTFFKYVSIFSFSDSDRLDEEGRAELLRIYMDGTKQKKAESKSKKEYKPNLTSVSEVRRMEKNTPNKMEQTKDEKKKTISTTITLSDSINELPLSTRAYNALCRILGNRRRTVRFFLNLTEGKIREIPNVGKKTSNEIISIQEAVREIIKPELQNSEGEIVYIESKQIFADEPAMNSLLTIESSDKIEELPLSIKAYNVLLQIMQYSNKESSYYSISDFLKLPKHLLDPSPELREIQEITKTIMNTKKQKSAPSKAELIQAILNMQAYIEGQERTINTLEQESREK